MKKFWICEKDMNGQRTGEFNAVEIPNSLVVNRDGLNYLAVDYINESGYTEPAGTCFLFTSWLQACRAALS